MAESTQEDLRQQLEDLGRKLGEQKRSDIFDLALQISEVYKKLPKKKKDFLRADFVSNVLNAVKNNNLLRLKTLLRMVKGQEDEVRAERIERERRLVHLEAVLSRSDHFRAFSNDIRVLKDCLHSGDSELFDQYFKEAEFKIVKLISEDREAESQVLNLLWDDIKANMIPELRDMMGALEKRDIKTFTVLNHFLTARDDLDKGAHLEKVVSRMRELFKAAFKRPIK